MSGLAIHDMHIGFDFDGVILDHTSVKLELTAAMGFRLSPEQVTSDALRDIIQLEERTQLQKMLYDDPAHSLRSPVMPGAWELLDFLRARRIPFSLITRRKNAPHALDIMTHHKLRPRFFNHSNTYVVPSIEDKVAVAATLGVTHYIDDESEVIKAMTGIISHTFVLDVFGNTIVPDGATRLRSLDEFRLMILK